MRTMTEKELHAIEQRKGSTGSPLHTQDITKLLDDVRYLGRRLDAAETALSDAANFDPTMERVKSMVVWRAIEAEAELEGK